LLSKKHVLRNNLPIEYSAISEKMARKQGHGEEVV